MSFDLSNIALGLREAARITADGVAGAEELAARLPAGAGIDCTLRSLRWRSDQVLAAHQFFKAIAPHEAEIMALLARQNTGEAA